ncbi:MAG TPA: hypothetical protein VF278_03245 [Pirellulales bacterium]
MSIVLLDTNIASLLHPKKKAAALRRRYEPHMRGQTKAVGLSREMAGLPQPPYIMESPC